MTFTEISENKKPLKACIHLLPLTGAPGFDGNMSRIIDHALSETEIYKNNNVDALIIENFRDYHFYPGQLLPETIAALSAVASEVKK